MARQIFFEKIGKKASIWYSFFIRNENRSLLEQIQKRLLMYLTMGQKFDLIKATENQREIEVKK